MAYAESPKGLSKWQQVVRNAKAFGTFLYDKEKGEVMGRGAESWGKITVFFIIFYLCLAGFFAAMLNVFLATMPDPAKAEGPKFTQYLAGRSALRISPSHKISNFNKDKSGEYNGYVNSINDFLSAYKQQNDTDFAAEYCNFTSTKPMPSGQEKQCKFDLTQLGPCYSNANGFSYGYGDGAPCFFMKMNKVYDWVPEPDDGLSYIKIVCEGAKVYPEQTPGFPVGFFPYRGQGKWLSPIVAVQINGTSNEEAKCSAYAKNVERSSTFLLERGAYNRVRIQIQ
ncbi:sodium/potassium-transporting ATPase subunit beta-1-like [Actinia tenebrosa]|uniref:Sodium/potassium-transporting ATPase subunit beta-1-like n=1 Tax=Actinia tenebrosa TaxID=6105 RepID=A0A6P8HFV6_ACTTE|nr:sodium/potassium-transporting ATPase subunit beta-1-like [Actinia tenebrosa]